MIPRLRLRAANRYGLVGGIGQHENTWRMAHVGGPEGIVVSLTERIDAEWLPATYASFQPRKG